MTAFPIDRIEYFYCNSQEHGRDTSRSRPCAPPRFIGPLDLSDHLLRDIGVLDGHEVGHGATEPAHSSRDLVDRYR